MIMGQKLAHLALVLALLTGPAAAAQECDISSQTRLDIAPFRVGQMAHFKILRRPVYLGDHQFQNKNDETVKISDWKGQVMLLNLWATWCAPCRREMPALDRLQKNLGSKDFAVVPVSMDRGGAVKPVAFYQKNNLTNLPIYVDSSNELFEVLKEKELILGLPTTFLIGRDGCAIGTFKRAAEWDEKDAVKLIEAAL